jgi:RNA polymerase sigma-70 factor (ECF subfamily)
MQQPAPDPSDSARGMDKASVLETVGRARAGDRSAFETLYSYYKKPIWRRLVHLVGDEESAHDLFQETFLRIWIKLPETHGSLQFEPWLYRITANIAIDYLRHRKKMVFLPLPEDGLEERNSTGFPNTESHEEHLCDMECMKQALATMSPQYRTCLLLQVAWGFSQCEIADILKISEKCVSAYVSRGYRQLRRVYRQFSE